jgi:integrase
VRKKLTKASVDAANWPVEGRVVWDTDLKGFGLRVTPNNTKTYIFQYRMGGRGTRCRTLTIGRHGSPWTPEKARKAAEEHSISVRQGNDPQSQKLMRRSDAEELAFDKYVERFVTDYLEVQWPGSGVEAKRLLNREAVPHFRSTPLPSISKRDVTALFDKLKPRPGIAKNTSTALRRLFNWACERGELDHSPMDRVPLPKGPVARDRYLGDAELTALWKATLRFDHPYASLVRALILLGQRRDEVGAMTWEEIDVENAVWLLAKDRTKNNKAHAVPLSKQALAELQSSPHEEGFLFSVNGKKPLQNWSKLKIKLDKLFDEEAKKAGLEKPAAWKLHDLRRSVATGMQRLGEHVDTVEAFCNRQVREGVAGRYQRHAYEDEKRAAAQRWADHVEGLLAQQVEALKAA